MSVLAPIERDSDTPFSAVMVASIAGVGVGFAVLFALPNTLDAGDGTAISAWFGALQVVLVCALLAGVTRVLSTRHRLGLVATVGLGVTAATIVTLFGPHVREVVSQSLSIVGVLTVVGTLVWAPPYRRAGGAGRFDYGGRGGTMSGSDAEPSGALKALHSAAVLRDGDTQDHGQAVAKLAASLGARLGMPPVEVRALYWAALLHDVGKVGVERSVLLKPDKLTADEYLKVMRHPDIGADLIRSVGPEALLREIALMVLHHHERWDGRGYPSGRRSTEIPVGARIIAITDVFQALLCDRPYRPAMSYDDALRIIVDGSGSHFDPDIVSVFLRMLSEQAYADASLLADTRDGVSTRDVVHGSLRPVRATLAGLRGTHAEEVSVLAPTCVRPSSV